MLTPGMAPNNIPPITPKINIPIEKGSPKRAMLPAIKLSIKIRSQVWGVILNGRIVDSG